MKDKDRQGRKACDFCPNKVPECFKKLTNTGSVLKTSENLDSIKSNYIYISIWKYHVFGIWYSHIDMVYGIRNCHGFGTTIAKVMHQNYATENKLK